MNGFQNFDIQTEKTATTNSYSVGKHIMKNITLKILLLIYSNLLFSQSKSEKLNLTTDSDTVYWNKIVNEKIEKYNLGFENKKDELFFRFWKHGNCIEITKKDTLIVGKSIYFVDEVDDFSKKNFVKTFDLKKSICEKILKLIDSSKISTIPSDKFIKDWQQGFDGTTYIFEYKTKTEYSFKNYWTPTSQKNLEEAKKIQNFIDKLYRICDSENLSKQFTKEIPFRSYTYNGSPVIVSRIMTTDEYKKYLKEKRKIKKHND